MTTSDTINLWSAIITGVIALLTLLYVLSSYLLLKRQTDQFKFSNRPWVRPTDVRLFSTSGENTLTITFINHGKLPALCNVSIDNVKLSSPWLESEREKDFEPIAILQYTVFPYVHREEDVHTHVLDFPKDQLKLLTDGNRLSFQVCLEYRELVQSAAKFNYQFVALYDIESINHSEPVQSATVIVADAT